MTILKQLNIHNLRNIEALSLDLHPAFNFLIGDNGAGKTSVLEAIHILSSGRSFRSRLLRTITRHQEQEFTVFGRLEDGGSGPFTIGVTRNVSGLSSIRLSNTNVGSASVLAHSLPVLLLDADTFSVLDGAPQTRRSLFDWLVFHVEQKYSILWRDYVSGTKQRNILLRRGKIRYPDLRHWDEQIARIAVEIEALRRDCFDSFVEVLFSYLKGLNYIESSQLSLSYRHGWGSHCEVESNSKEEYLRALEQAFPRDLQLGYSHLGSHKYDLLFRQGKSELKDLLSRGQKKAFLIALVASLATCYESKQNKKPVILLDDLASELDQHNMGELFTWLRRFSCQCVVTGVSGGVYETHMDGEDNYKVFHVKQGQVQ